MKATVEDRFWAKAILDGPVHPELGPCWVWTAFKDQDGYGRFWDGSYLPSGYQRKIKAHVMAWRFAHGDVPPDRELDHLCRRRDCVRVSHLEVVTHRENLLRSQHTLASQSASRQSCPQGHPYDHVNARGFRMCLRCERDRSRRRRARGSPIKA